jgi:DNA-binding response OmpR family regulator
VAEQPDLIVLDLMLPSSTASRCKRSAVLAGAVVMLAARGEQVDKLRGFEAGADDYPTKPFAPPSAAYVPLRRAQTGGPTSHRRSSNAAAEYRLRPTSGTGQRRAVKLTPTEFQLLQQLALNAGALSHTELLTKVWGPEYRDDRDICGLRAPPLRRKLGRILRSRGTS